MSQRYATFSKNIEILKTWWWLIEAMNVIKSTKINDRHVRSQIHMLVFETDDVTFGPFFRWDVWIQNSFGKCPFSDVYLMTSLFSACLVYKSACYAPQQCRINDVNTWGFTDEWEQVGQRKPTVCWNSPDGMRSSWYCKLTLGSCSTVDKWTGYDGTIHGFIRRTHLKLTSAVGLL